MIFSIAVDGPVGAGKSSVADGVAERLGILHLDTGAMYRAFAYRALREGVPQNDEAALTEMLKGPLPEVRFENGAQRTLIKGEDVTEKIRTPEISMAASTVSKFAAVRKAMVALQRELAKKQSMVMDGRDIGTVVLTDATLKIYLTASAEIRARRRFDETQASGKTETSYEQVLADVIARDTQDTTRAVDPLRPAEDAQILDSSYLTQEQVVESILRRLNLKLGKKPERCEPFTRLYKVAVGLGKFLFHTLLPVSYHFEEEALLDAPYILTGNHNHLLDPVLIGCGITRYQVRFMGKKELTSNPVLAKMFQKLLMIPVDRHNMDMSAIRASLKTLKEGHVLGIFPEGTRHHKGVMENIESGTAMIALRAGVPILPAYMTGKPRLFHRIHVYYGRPIYLNSILARGINADTCAETNELLRGVYREMERKFGSEFSSSDEQQ